MIIKAKAMNVSEARDCHAGSGRLWCREVYGDYQRPDPGIKFVHDDLIEPGASIGEHRHDGDEEFYYILEGAGEMTMDGTVVTVGAGDFGFTQSGQRHSLRNTGSQPMRLLVVCANTPAQTD
jgi:redox-sensitive bicupin YhaK (pirin superfamily)